jgi:integrase
VSQYFLERRSPKDEHCFHPHIGLEAYMQQGSMILTGRKFGPDVWQFRWSEKDRSGRRIYHKRVIGTVQQYPDVQAAREVTTALVGHINAGAHGCKITVEQICEHFEQRELRSGDSFRSFATAKTYRGYIRKWIKPHWGSRYLDEIKAVDVEAWLRRLPMARSSRAKIRSILSILFNHACRYELFDRNPMRFVRQGAKRRSAPNVLTAAEIKVLVDHLPLRERTLVLLAAATGLRQSELFGLKWRDVDFKGGELSVIRSIVFGVVGRCKTESSQKPVPMHPLLGDALLTWRKTCKFTGVDDWIFASRLHKGRRPYWGASILRNYVRPVAATLNIQKRIGWHTFRHTYSTLLRSVGAEFKVMQELMRHSTLRTTMDVYTQAVAPAKHAAQAAVLALFFPMTDDADDDSIIGIA